MKLLTNYMTEPPDRPESLAVTHIESRSAIISWITPYSGNQCYRFI